MELSGKLFFDFPPTPTCAINTRFDEGSCDGRSWADSQTALECLYPQHQYLPTGTGC